MKTKLISILAVLLMMIAGMQTASAQKILVRLTDNQLLRFDISQVDYVTFLEDESVDLALPSGTLWATCNVGAAFPEEYGNYFAWGETEPKDAYVERNYPFISNGKTTKYNATDGMMELLLTDDAAAAALGSMWLIPNKEQWDELIDASNTTIEWTQQNGVNGKKITSIRNGNSIFLPAAGSYTTALFDAGKEGHYWSRTLNAEKDWEACYLCFDYTNFIGTYYVDRYYGMCVRPVMRQKTLVSWIMLNHESLTFFDINGNCQLRATVEPSDADNTVVAWESSNDAVATVTSDGMVIAKGVGNCTITCSATDGSGVKAECQVTVILPCPDDNHPHAIDLGLPSGTKWACCNVGANTPEGLGGFYAWGETTTKGVYDDHTYAYYIDNEGYINIGSDIAGTEYDAATANWGEGWQMPSVEQISELVNNCSSQWTQVNGMNGLLLTGPNGCQVFLPAAGGRWDDTLQQFGVFGYYWSSSLYLDDEDYYSAYCMYLGSDRWNYIYYTRYGGRNIRPVRKK